MGLSQLLSKELNKQFANDNGGWRQYILDHLDYIAVRTKPTEITVLVMNQFRYDLPRFLKEQLSILEDIGWIVLLLNDLSSDLEFDKAGIYIIPTESLIGDMFQSYKTISSNRFQ